MIREKKWSFLTHDDPCFAPNYTTTKLQNLHQFQLHVVYTRSWEQKAQFITIHIFSNFCLPLTTLKKYIRIVVWKRVNILKNRKPFIFFESVQISFIEIKAFLFKVYVFSFCKETSNPSEGLKLPTKHNE